jgi:hypothetical protein
MLMPRVVKNVDTAIQDEEEEAPAAEGEDEEAPKPAAAPVAKKGKEQEYVEYSTGWMVAGETEDDTPELKITDLQEGYR